MNRSDKRRGQNYEVGYGKPPKHTQFQKGKSGNQKGRPKASTSLAHRLEELLGEAIMVTINGEPDKLKRQDAILTALISKAIRGDTQSIRLIFAKLAEKEQKETAIQQQKEENELRFLTHEEALAQLRDIDSSASPSRSKKGSSNT